MLYANINGSWIFVTDVPDKLIVLLKNNPMELEWFCKMAGVNKISFVGFGK